MAKSLNDMGVAIVKAVKTIVTSLPYELKIFKKSWNSVQCDSQAMLLLRLKQKELELNYEKLSI